jgi:uncharacterized membrane protein YidH (DUF202 family)
MNKAQRKKFFGDLMLRFTVLFTVVILSLSIAGLILARVNSKEHDITKIFAYENPGLPYSYIAILACIVFAITLISFAAEAFLKNNRNRYDELFRKHKIYRKKKMT